MVVDGTALSLTGTVDTNYFSTHPEYATHGNDHGVSNRGRTFGTLSNQLFSTRTMNVTFYLIDSNHGYFVEADSLRPTALSDIRLASAANCRLQYMPVSDLDREKLKVRQFGCVNAEAGAVPGSPQAVN